MSGHPNHLDASSKEAFLRDLVGDLLGEWADHMGGLPDERRIVSVVSDEHQRGVLVLFADASAVRVLVDEVR